MNTEFVDNRFNRFFKWLTIHLTFLLTFVLFYTQSHAQQSALTCNSATPWIPPTFDYTTAFTQQFPFSFWTNPNNISDDNTSSFATGTIVLAGTITYRITDAEQTYSAGNFAGFAIENGTIGLGLFSGVTINTYLDGGLQESFTASDLLTLDVNLFNSPFQIGFITTEDYDAVEIEINGSGLYVGTVLVYYPVMKKFCAGPSLVCNTPTAMNNATFPTQIDYALTGSGDVDFGNVGNPEDAISSSTTDYATLNNLIEDGPVYITIGEQVTNYPGGTFVGFDIQNEDILSISLLSNISITTRRDGVIKQTKSGPSLLLGATALQGGRQIVGFVADSAFDKATLTLNQTGVELGTTRVYSAIFQTFCAGPPLVCNTQQAITSPTHPLYIEMNHTGFGGPVCALCGVFDAGNVIDADLSNFAQINIGVEALAEGRLSVRNPVTNYPVGTFAGFHIENEVLVGANILSGITIRTFLDGVQMQEVNSTGPLVTLGTELLGNLGEQIVGIVTTTDFDEVQIELDNLGTVDLGTTKVYNLVIQDFCTPALACEQVYYLTHPDWPVYINAFRTGLDELVCAGSSVVDEQNLLTPSNADFGLITIAAGASCAGSIAVADALNTYPAGTAVGFVIEDLELLIQATLFEGITVSTYNNGTFVESRTAGSLLDLNLLILFIGDGPGVYNLGFVSTQPFDEVVIEVDPLVAALYRVRVYSAFVNTNLSEGGSLMCDDTPDAVADIASTDEDTPLNGSAQTNDTPSNDGGNEWELVGVNGGATHGTVTMNPDGTYTYTPDANYTGPDSFTYQICDVNNDCDQATVSITVNSVDDFPVAQDDSADTNEDTPVNGSAQSNDTPSGDGGNTWSLVGVDGGAQHGTVTMEPDGDYTYTPDPNYNGPDQFTYQICDADGDCEEATVSINIDPVDDQPSATDDNVSTDEDTPLNGNVAGNDTPSGDGGNTWTVTGDVDHGDLDFNPDGTYTYTPDPNYNGPDLFTYEVCDVDGDCSTATVTINVEPIDDQPIAEDDTETTEENTPLSSTVTTNDTPSGDGGNTWTVTDDVDHGDLDFNPDGTYTYTPDPNYTGLDQFTYEVCDVDGDCSTATVTINVDPLLPIELLDFEVTKKDRTAVLDWTTSYESNLDYFEVQRAGEDKHFTAVGKVSGAGNSTSIQSYRFVDSSPFSGTNFYRLRAVDYDGKEDFSPIRSVQFETRTPQFSIRPNPTVNDISISSDDLNAGPIEIIIMSLDGRPLYHSKLDSQAGESQISLHDLNPGVYRVTIRGNGFEWHEKVVKVE